MISKKGTTHYLLFTGLWLLAILIVNPVAETPLNDDWCYTKSVLDLLNTGKYTYGSWPSMTLIAQVYLGAAFTFFFGFSYTALRIATLIVSFFGIIFFYKLIRALSLNSGLALFSSVLLFFNPIYFSLSFTFMTEIYFLTFLLAAFYLYHKSLSKNNLLMLVLASIFAILSTLVRQPGILIIIVFLPFILFNKNIHLKIKIGFGISFLLVLLVLLIYQSWIKNSFPQAENFGNIKTLSDTLVNKDIGYFRERFLSIVLYPALFLLPLCVIFLGRISTLDVSKKRIFFSLWLVLFSLVILSDVEFPKGNLFGNLYLGPKLLKDGYWDENISPKLPVNLWLMIKYIAILNLSFLASFGIVLVPLKRQIKDFLQLSAKEITRFSLLIFAIGFIIFLMLNPILFDRYTLPLIVILFFVMDSQSWNSGRKTKYVAFVLTGFFVVFSVMATHDYLSWNRVVKEAFIYLTQDQKIRKDRIDAGFAVNGWYQPGPMNPYIKGEKSWWWVADDDYTISFGDIKGFRKEKSFPYFSYLKLKTDSIFIVTHTSEASLSYELFPLRCDMEKTDADKNYFLSQKHHIKFEKGFLQSNKKARSGKFSVCLTAEEPFALLSRYRNLKAQEKFTVKVWRFGIDTDIDAGIVLTSDMGNEFFYYEKDNIVDRKNGWVQLQLEFSLPNNFETRKIGIFLWNTSKQDVYFDDFEINRELIKPSE